MHVHPSKSFSLHCKQCDQVYFCSQQCNDQFLQSGKEHHVDHGRICALLRKLATLKADKHMKSVAKMILNLVWERARNEAGVHWVRSQGEWWKVGDLDVTRGLEELDLRRDITPVESNFDMVLALESHYHRWTSEDRQAWKKLGTFVHAALTEAKLLKEGDDMDFIMHLISRVESNGFGMYWSKPSKKRDQDPFGRGKHCSAQVDVQMCGCLTDIYGTLFIQRCFRMQHSLITTATETVKQHSWWEMMAHMPPGKWIVPPIETSKSNLVLKLK